MAKFTVIDGNRNQRGEFNSRADAEDYLANPPAWLNTKDAFVREIVSIPGTTAFNSYRLGYAVGYYQRRIRPRLSIQYWHGYLVGKFGPKKPPAPSIKKEPLP